MQSRLFHIHALSALHCGTGQSAGVVDLPIARARATQLPIVPGSSLRGVLRQEIGVRDPDLARVLFGPSKITDTDKAFAGALTVGDAHLLALPVRALAGIVCYATSSFILRRYAQDLKRAGNLPPQIPVMTADSQTAFITHTSANVLDGKLVLEDLDLDAESNTLAAVWATTIAAHIHPFDTGAQVDVVNRFAILPDNILGYLCETATEFRTRISIKEQTGTAEEHALWFEEHLPAETVLWGIQAISDSNEPGQWRTHAELALALPTGESLLQLGGQAGVGRGLVRYLTEEVGA